MWCICMISYLYMWYMQIKHNGMLFSLKKERNPTMCNNMDEPGGYYAKWSKSNTVESQLLWNPKNKTNEQTDSKHREQTGGSYQGGGVGDVKQVEEKEFAVSWSGWWLHSIYLSKLIKLYATTCAFYCIYL